MDTHTTAAALTFSRHDIMTTAALACRMAAQASRRHHRRMDWTVAIGLLVIVAGAIVLLASGLRR